MPEQVEQRVESGFVKGLGGAVARKAAASLAATAAGAATAYAIRRGPKLLEEALLPWVRERFGSDGSTSGGGSTSARDTPRRETEHGSVQARQARAQRRRARKHVSSNQGV